MSTTETIGPDTRARFARRARLGFFRLPPARMRRDLVRPAPPSPKEERCPAYAPVDMLARPSWQCIVKLVSLKHEVSVADILGPGRFAYIAPARREAAYLVYTHCGMSFSEVGKRFHKDHSTVRYMAIDEAAARGVALPLPVTIRYREVRHDK
jgi:hypothetical protein